MPSTSRRALVRALCVLAGALAGCQDQSNRTGTATSTRTGTGTLTDSRTPAEPGTATATSPATGAETESDTPHRRDERCEAVWNPLTRWRYETGLRSYCPTVADDVVYVGAQEGSFYALDVADGSVRWRADQRVRLDGRAAVVDGTVVVASYDEVAAYDAVSGDHRWTVAPPGQVGAVESDAVTDGDRVFFTAENRPGTMQATSVPRYHRLYALDVDDGESVWTVELPTDLDSGGIAATDGSVFVTMGDGRLLAFAADSGERTWEWSKEAALGSRPVLGTDAVYVRSEGRMTAVDAADGTRRWRRDGRFHGEPVVGGGAVYCTTERNLVALDPASGRRRWRAALPVWFGEPLGVTAETVFVAVEYDDRVEVVGYDGGEGCRLGSYEVRANGVTRVDASDDTVFFGAIGDEGDLYAVTRPPRRET